MRWQPLVLILILVRPASVWAQEGETGEVDRPSTGQSLPTAWVAAASGGLLQRDGGPDSPYGTFSLTRYKGSAYLRGALTVYRGTVRQIDAALPSSYYTGSIGGGCNCSDWVVDIFASYGRQDYGQVETRAGKRASQAGSGSPYFAAGARAGYVFRPAPRWYVTPTFGLQYAETKSLRHRIDFMTGRGLDFKLAEKALTGNATLRIDRALGARQQHFIGVSLTHFESSNGLTSWRLTGPPGSARPTADPIPDGWEELGLSATWQLSERVWLDGQVLRSFGAVAGDNSTITVGIRMWM